MKWERGVEVMMKQKRLRTEEAINWQIWRKVTDSQ
jgi:hypothetical protein